MPPYNITSNYPTYSADSLPDSILNGKNSNEVNTREKKIICKNSFIFLLKNSNP